ncbi:MAG: exodeoxyribonuclease III [Methanomassiliicoccales archaeon]
MRLISWNVNGIRALHRKGLIGWIEAEGADVYCLQETKAWREQLPKKLLNIPGYESHFAEANRKGYSGVATYTSREPQELEIGLGVPRFDQEGRVMILHYPEFSLFNVYFPNGKASEERLRFKMDFYEEFLERANQCRKRNGVVVCGDLNTAHRERDIARPRENSKVSGFLPEEREWIDRFLETGFMDSFRMFDPSPGRYTWWDLKTRARERNVGWRLDYFFVSQELRDRVRSAGILDQVEGSDHCPVDLVLDIGNDRLSDSVTGGER